MVSIFRAILRAVAALVCAAFFVCFVLVVAAGVGLHQLFAKIDAASWAPPFHSDDLRPVRVTLRTRDMPGSITFEVPRAWIVFSDDQSTKKFDEVPDRITTTGVHFELADPDATALSIRKRQLAGDGKMLRQAEYYVRLWRPDPTVSMEDWAQATGPRRIVELDGLEFDMSRGGQYLLRPVPGEIAEAHCSGSISPVSFCAHYIRLGPQLYATISFLNFRNHGGPEFAINRMRAIAARLCRQPGLECSPNWIAPAVPKT